MPASAMAISHELQASGLRATTARQLVLAVFERLPDSQLTADEVRAHLAGRGSPMPSATLYRVMVQLTSVGLIRKQQIGQGACLFELHRADRRDHLVCVDCGAIVECEDAPVAACAEAQARRSGYAVHHHKFIVYGSCGACAAAGGSAP